MKKREERITRLTKKKRLNLLLGEPESQKETHHERKGEKKNTIFIYTNSRKRSGRGKKICIKKQTTIYGL